MTPRHHMSGLESIQVTLVSRHCPLHSSFRGGLFFVCSEQIVTPRCTGQDMINMLETFEGRDDLTET